MKPKSPALFAALVYKRPTPDITTAFSGIGFQPVDLFMTGWKPIPHAHLHFDDRT